MNVERYKWDNRGGVRPCVDGTYVEYEDYEKLYDALYRIHNYPLEESLWDDDRDDAAWEIVAIAKRVLNLID